jgi:hypothetical protein
MGSEEPRRRIFRRGILVVYCEEGVKILIRFVFWTFIHIHWMLPHTCIYLTNISHTYCRQ